MRAELNLGAVQTVTPQMIASMTVLQYGTQELREYLEELSYENPLMELQLPDVEEAQKSFVDKLRWLQNGDRQNRSYYAGDTGRPEPQATQAHSIQDHLREQLLTLKASKAQHQAMAVIAGLLDDHGFFDGSISEIMALAGCSREIAQAALRQVQALEPAGIAQENVQNSLLAQLRRLASREPVAEQLIESFYDRLGSWPDWRLAKQLGVPVDAVQRARQAIAGLTPYPADGFASGEEIIYVRPDVYVTGSGDALTVTGNEDAVPKVRIHREYLNMLDTEQDPEVQKYLRQKLGQLEQVMENLENRTSTVLRCAEIIAARQAAFFGGGALVKMTLRDVAEEMEVHESTVSRTVKNKYLQCERGIYAMSDFFSRSAGQNFSLSRDNIKDILSEIIRGEDPARPYSDERLSEELLGQNVILSRRAVAKYRTELGIPPASARRQGAKHR